MKYVRVLLTLGLLVLITGCWDSIELNRRAVVSGVAMDIIPGKEERIKATLQVIVADEISGKTSRGGTPVSVYEGEGKTIFEAVRNTSRKVPRYLSLGHISAIVISEDLARHGIRDLLDFLERDAQVRSTSLVFIARGQQASDVMSVLTPLGKIPSGDLFQKADAASKLLGYNYRVQIDDIIRGMQASGGGPVINGVEIEGNIEDASKSTNIQQVDTPSVLALSGIAAFRKDKLVGWLDTEQSRGVTWANNHMKQTVLVTGCAKLKGNVSYSIIRSITKRKGDLGDPTHPKIHLDVRAQANIRELDCSMDITNADNLTKLQHEVDQNIQQMIEASIKKAQRLHTDIFEFGDLLERENPKMWKKVRAQWGDLFPVTKITCEVHTVIRSAEMRNKSYHYKLDQTK
ncbi:spore germination protein KC [Paenibacillus shirakamiensis]|uniref:Spore germination protein KC n=1 Tax=Paenibacillus shirakamiensis TaxID=1265935 RepID=A0ABS4JJK4_9BACL|nr:Ger(x)C family spore germination protein [Paenibacillus shirakamiensis]MBP2001882.1 spore germination protein KC [Paenibacillus shirakamiensis]